MKIGNLLAFGLFASILLIFLGCSDGGDDSSSVSGNATDNVTGFQIYSDDGSKYNESGVIRLEVYGPKGYEYIDLGTVTDGIGSLDFSVTIPSEYHQTPYPNSLSISPPNAKGVEVFSFHLISGNSAYKLQQRNANETEYVFYLYVPEQTTVKGTEKEDGYSFEFDINAKQGWNAVYNKVTYTKEIYSTNSRTVNLNNMKWIIDDEESAGGFGGPG